MPDGGGGGRRLSPGRLVTTTALGCAVSTVAVVVLPFIRFAYRAPALHVALETGNAIVALLVGYLVFGRFAENRRLRELLLVLAMCTVAIANLVLTAVPSALTIASIEEFSRWAALAIRLLGTLLLTAAALASPSLRLRRGRVVLVVLGVTLLVLALTVAGLRYGDRLPPTVDPTIDLTGTAAPQLVAHPVVLAVQATGAVLYAVAAVAFAVRAGRRGDELLSWVAAGCVLAAFASVHYLLFPSLYSDYVYTGDVLRTGFYLFILVGAAREIRSYWELRTRTAVLEDRRRLARDLHDGLSQELAYIWSQSQHLVREPGDPVLAERIGGAAGRALDEARRAIATLTRPMDEPFPDTLERRLEDLAARYDVKIMTDLAPDVRVRAPQGEALLRIAAEAVRNAVRHGAATRIDVVLTADPPALVVADDGRGFAAPRERDLRTGGFGITSMRERARSFGGTLDITSEPGRGTTVSVTW